MVDPAIEIGTTLRQRIWLQLGSRQIWTLGLAILAAFLYAITAIAYDSVRLHNFELGWLPIWIGTYFEAVAIAFGLLWVLPQSLWSTARKGRWTNFFIAFTAGAIKNSTVFFWAKAVGLETSQFDALVRIVGGGTLGVSAIWMFIGLNGSRIRHRELMARLLDQQDRLIAYRSKVSNRATEAQAELVEQTKQIVLPKLAEIDQLLGDTQGRLTAATDLQKLVETAIRPLSRAFQEQAGTLAATEIPKEKRKGVRRIFPPVFRVRENLSPIAAVLMLLPSQTVTVYMLDGAAGAIKATPSTIVTLALVFVTTWLLPKNRPFKRRAGMTLLIVISTLVSIPQLIMLSTGLLAKDEDMWLLVLSILGQNVAGLLSIAYLNILDENRIRLETELAAVNDQINHELAVFNQVLWLQKRRWGYLLHGSVQATLTAAIARLKSLDRLGQDEQRNTEAGMIIALVRQDLRRVAETITNPPAKDVDLVAELKAIQDTWRGVVEISVNISDRAKRVLVKSDNTRMALNEICREAVTNAFRHGKASAMSIRIDRTSEDEIDLQITNNGSHPGEVSKGMGLQMMDALTLDWRFEPKKTAALTVLSARLPVALN